jgi:dephospho-CoA kinase
VVVLVDCEEEVRIQRVIARSGMERREIKRRMALQMDADEKKARADIVVDNNGDMAQLRERAHRLWLDLNSWRQGWEENDRG